MDPAPTRHAAASQRPSGKPDWVSAVLEFWLGLPPAQWFAKNDALDAQLRERFEGLHARLSANPLERATTPREALAMVIVLDQFSRNLHRGSARAFAADAAARRIAEAALGAGWDVGLSAGERLFFCLPFEHSEAPADQARAVALTQALGNANWSRYARAHQDIIARFGRFPHRNALLGRESTAEERTFLDGPGSSF